MLSVRKNWWVLFTLNIFFYNHTRRRKGLRKILILQVTIGKVEMCHHTNIREKRWRTKVIGLLASENVRLWERSCMLMIIMTI